jgi:hypothetical protein
MGIGHQTDEAVILFKPELLCLTLLGSAYLAVCGTGVHATCKPLDP